MAKGYQHVTQEVRCQIYALKSTGQSQRMIAERLGVDASTISREMKRNSGSRGYRYKQANEKAKSRRSSASQKKKKLLPELLEKIKEKLLDESSPEQISGRLKKEGLSISHETIYDWIWKDKRAGGEWYKRLRHHGKRYNKRSSKSAGRGCIPNRIDISERPAAVEKKSRIGDWEGDTIVSKGKKSVIVSYVDRHSKYTKLKKLPSKHAELVKEATIEKLGSLPLGSVKTITYDNGKEFSKHESIAEELKASCYFARPYHSWERGLNEHTNGLDI